MNTQVKVKLYDTFPLGADARCHISSDSRVTQLNNNMIVVGGSGSGKTESVLKPMINAMRHTNPVAVFTKLSALDASRQILESHGYRVDVLDLDRPQRGTLAYDPLLMCRDMTDVRDLAHCIGYANYNANGSTKASDPFWPESCAGIANVILRYVYGGHYYRGRSMACALELFDRVSTSSDSNIDIYISDNEPWLKRRGGQKLTDEEKEEQQKAKLDSEGKISIYDELKRLKQIDPADYATWRTVGDSATPQTAASIESTLRAAVNNMFSDSIRDSLKGERLLDFKDLLQEKTALLVYVSPVSTAQHCYTSLFYHQLFAALFNLAEEQPGYVLPHPVQVLCDDFATGCRVPDFDKLISIFREKGIATTLLIQSESQLEAMYGAMPACTIVNNCDTYVYLGGIDRTTCRHMSERLSLPFAEVQSMPIGCEYFLRRGQRPIKTRRYTCAETLHH